MSSSQSGSNLRLKHGRSRSRGRPIGSTKQSKSALTPKDNDDCQRMTRSRSKSRGRVPVTVQQHGQNKEGAVIGARAHIGSSSRIPGSSGLIYKTDTCSTTSNKILQGPRPRSQQETSFNSSVGVVGPPVPYNVYPVPAEHKDITSVPYGLPMFSFLSTPMTPNPANQASRKRPPTSIPFINYAKRRNSNTDELPGCHFRTTHEQTNKDAPTNARSRSNQIIVSPLNRLFNETSAHHTPHHSSFSQRMSSYPDIEIIPVSAHDNFDCDEERHSTARPGNGGGVQIDSNRSTDAEEATLSISSYVDGLPTKRIPFPRFPIRKEYSVSTNLENSSVLLQKQVRSITGKKADEKTGRMKSKSSMQQSDNVTITPVVSITDDEDDGSVSRTTYTSVSGAEDEVNTDNSAEAVVGPVSKPISGYVPASTSRIEMPTHDECNLEQISGSGVPGMERNNAEVMKNYDGDDEQEEEYHDTFEQQEVDKLHAPTENFNDEEKYIIKPKKNWCTIV